MSRERIDFLFLNVGHLYTHMFMLLFATVAALALAGEWHMSYSGLIPWATPGFVAFGAMALPAGWLADRWSRRGMMLVFFLGIGASALLAGAAQTPLALGGALLLMGCFGAIYHPVGIAMVVQEAERTGTALAINGVWGNLGVACAALVAGTLIDLQGWRAAFIVPGAVGVATGLGYALFLLHGREVTSTAASAAETRRQPPSHAVDRATLLRIFAIVFFSTACGSLVYQCTTFSLPKVFAERIGDVAHNPTEVGGWAFVVFAIAAVAQVVVGNLIDRRSLRTVFLVVAGLQPPVFALMTRLSGVPALLGAVAFMLLVFGQIPINDTLVARVTASEWRSRVYGLKFVLTFTVMAGAVPLVAWLHTAWGFSGLFGVMAAVAALMFLAVSLLPRGGAVLAMPRTAGA